MLRHRFLNHFDWPVILLTVTLLGIGLISILSATYCHEQPISLFFKKQAFGASCGLIIFFFATQCNYRALMKYGYFCYFALLAILFLTFFKGSIGMGAQRWIDIGILKFQPSELCKLLFPAFLAYFVQTQKQHKQKNQDFCTTIGILIISVLLILKQPDLGTAILIAGAGGMLMYAAGLDKKWYALSFMLAIILAPLGFKHLKPYQQKRIAVFFGQGSERNERYQIEQSKIAIGSGGLTGKGYLQGTQNILQFLPESRTDFIFAVIAEEWGFVGTCIVLLLYLLLIFRLLYMTALTGDPYAQLLSLGLIAHIFLSIYINMCMVLGLLPIVGIPLPLMSYGISNLWVVLASIGWCTGIYKQQRIYN